MAEESQIKLSIENLLVFVLMISIIFIISNIILKHIILDNEQTLIAITNGMILFFAVARLRTKFTNEKEEWIYPSLYSMGSVSVSTLLLGLNIFIPCFWFSNGGLGLLITTPLIFCVILVSIIFKRKLIG